MQLCAKLIKMCIFAACSSGHDIFICSISHPNCDLEQENKEPILTSVGAALIMCRLLHRTLKVVADLDESMVGLHFSLYEVGAGFQLENIVLT